MPHVKFKKTGKWAEHNPALPQIEVKKDDVLEVSHELAEVIVDAGAGEVVKAPKKTPTKAEGNKPKEDKNKAEGSTAK